MIKPNRETVAGQRRHRPPPTGGRFCDTAATTCVQEAHRTPSSTNRKQVGGIVGRYTSGDSAGSALRFMPRQLSHRMDRTAAQSINLMKDTEDDR